MAQAAVVAALTDKFTSMVVEKIFQEVSLVTAFEEDFISLCDEINTINELLMNAMPLIDCRDEMVSSSMSNWLTKVEEFLADADYIVDDCMTVTNCQFRNPIFRYMIGRKIMGLKNRINIIKNSSKIFKYFESVLAMNDRLQTADKSEGKEITSSPVFTEQGPVGMENDINKITDLILQKEGSQRIAIVGMGGSGKTLLLQHVFNNKRVVEAGFLYRVWLSISRKFEYQSLLVEICSQTKPSISRNALNENVLKEKVKNLLNGNRCLFVMDDVWDHINLENIGLDLQKPKSI